ncbi:MAG: FtsQ-type POTRA domain-containing protein, partial [Nitrospira sp.]
MRVTRQGWRLQRGTPRVNVRQRTPRPSPRPRGRTPMRPGRAKIVRLLFVLLGVGVSAWLAWEVKTHLDQWLVIREITIDGNQQTTKQELVARLSLKPGATLMTVSPSFLASRLEAHPWIKRAVVERKPLHTLAIIVTERRVAAVVGTGVKRWLVDDEGVVLGALSEDALPTFPVLTGLDGRRLLRGEVEAQRVVRLGVRLAGLLAGEFSGRPHLQLEDPDHVVATVEGVRVEFGPAAQEEQWGRFTQLRQAMRGTGVVTAGQAPTDVDLRYPGKVIVRE